MILILASLLTLMIQPGSDAYQLNRQGRLLLDQHRYSAAVRVFRQAVDKAKADPGPQDPATAMILRNLALAYVQTGNFAAAEQSSKLALSIIESRFGPNEPGLTPILNVLAECYASEGRIAVARQSSERAVAIGPLAGPHYGIALHNLAAMREFSGDLEAAASLYRRAITAKIEALGAKHPYVALSKSALRRVERGGSIASPIEWEHGGVPAN